MRRRHWLWLAASVNALACSSGEATENAAARASAVPAIAPAPEPHTGEINPHLLRRFQPVVGQGGVASVTPEKITLGRMLFFDERLSKAHDRSCNSCHDLAAYGADGLVSAVGHKGQRGTRNTPSVYNAASHVAQFWDGRAETVEQQAVLPILNPLEMANSEERVVQTLASMPRYVELFREAYPGVERPLTLANVGDAIGAFERGLTTRSRWNDYIAGQKDALSAQEKRGLRVFLEVGCMACHTGPQVGASMFQRVGVIEPWPNQADVGRAAITNAPGDKMVFKVPSLVNIAKTGPYFHDGSAATLQDAIRIMGRYQVGAELSDEEVGAIATWMGALTGTVDASYIRPPALPPSTQHTPKPVLD